MGFVQIIEYRTSDIDGIRKVGEEWEAASEGQSAARRRVICEDKDNPGHYMTIVFFDSHESAMENSNNPVTQEYSQKMMALADGEPTFYNLDIIDDRA